MIDLNATMFIQLLNFLVTLVFLNFLLVEPVRAIIRKRKAKLADDAACFEQFSSKASDQLEQYESALQKTRQQGEVLRQQLREQGVSAQQALVAKATHDAQLRIAQNRDESRQGANAARQRLEGELPQMVELALGKLLG